MTDAMDLSREVMEYALCAGACAAGIATTETLAGGPPSTDLSFVLPGARSAVSFAVALDQNMIKAFLKKKDRFGHERDSLRANYQASGIAGALAQHLRDKGFEAVAVLANGVYRSETEDPEDESLDRRTNPDTERHLFPDISHRYLAVRSGVGSFGLSGNVQTKDEGAGVILASVVTQAELVPTDPVPEEETYCDDCKLCMAACLSRMMDETGEKDSVSLGGVEFSHSKRGTHLRCELVCGGFTGLHPSGKWSTWSPGRFLVPENDEDFPALMTEAWTASLGRPPLGGGFLHHLMVGQRVYNTCGNCQLVCHPDRAERKRRFKMLKNGGVVVQNEDGSLSVCSPDEAKPLLEAMAPARRALYERVP